MAGGTTVATKRKKTTKADPIEKNGDNKEKNKDKDDSTSPTASISLTEQLDRAQAAVERSQLQALALHSQWRTQLLRMSYIVIIISMYQMQTTAQSCIQEIKQWNVIRQNSMEEPMSGMDAIWFVLHIAHVEILSVLCGACLLWCLTLPMDFNDFATFPYRTSCAIVPMIVSLYFQNKDLKGGCIPSSEGKAAFIEDIQGDNNGGENDTKERVFPIILVYHTMVSLCLFFMQFQNSQHDKNIEMVRKMRRDLLAAQQGKTQQEDQGKKQS